MKVDRFNNKHQLMSFQVKFLKNLIFSINLLLVVRPSVNDAAKLQLKEDLRKFIIPPVMRAVDVYEPVEYLTEMRSIVILFINIVPQKIDLDPLVDLVDKCYKIVCS